MQHTIHSSFVALQHFSWSLMHFSAAISLSLFDKLVYLEHYDLGASLILLNRCWLSCITGIAANTAFERTATRKSISQEHLTCVSKTFLDPVKVENHKRFISTMLVLESVFINTQKSESKQKFGGARFIWSLLLLLFAISNKSRSWSYR